MLGAEIRVAPEEPGDGSGDCRHAKFAFRGLLARESSRRGQFSFSADDGWRLQLVRRPLRCRFLPSVPTCLCSTPPTPVHPLAGQLPLPESSWPAASGAVRSDDSTAVYGRLTAVKVCDGSANGGKTAQSDERPPGTTVPRRETGRHRLGTVPSGGGPS